MSRKDYRLLAAALERSHPEWQADRGEPLVDEVAQWHADVNSIADALQGANPRFNRAKFLAAALPTRR
jgi:hypothetical protein